MNIMSYQSIPAVLRENARKYSKKTAISYKKKGGFLSLNYEEFYERVLMLARGLQKAGMQPGDKVAIFSENRLGWAISDFGIQCAGGITVPIYATNTGKQAAYILNHCGAKIVFCSTKGQYEKLLSVKEDIPGVELVIAYERFMGARSFPVYTQYQLSEAGTPLEEEEKKCIEEQIDKITQDDILTIIYTSGTTGVPKGVLLTQGNVMVNADVGSNQLGVPQENMTTLSFLPLSHVLERTGGYYATLLSGNHIAFAENVSAVMENMMEIRPTSMVSVPRLFEKIYSRVYESVHQMPQLRRNLFHKAIEVGREYVNKKYVKKQPLGLLRLRYKFYDRLIFKKIRSRFGGKLQFFLCGGAPLDKSICEFMWIIGIPVFCGYGLTETSPAVTMCSAGNVRFDSVGKLLRDSEARLADDGELLVKGPQLMRGYYDNEEATREVMEDGWFKTGDIARIDEEGFVYIVDRKKELIVTAGGKNIAPQPIENELKLDKYISQAMVYGDRKPYIVAILTPNLERLIDWARQENISYIDIEELVNNRKVKDLFAGRIDEINSHYPPYKTIKYFAVVPRDFSIEGGELTPTLKLKRKVIYEQYKEIIEELYEANGSGIIAQPKKIILEK
ncbi:long-chain fatty acid--CoA ligase [Desulforhopalus sp. IMCC35007]|uniref:AMP-dependent synthetase/ligase n=1 Tax=Desulforhopalus sp. IMCC35007 TaxID=2569543 RepID=UPI0010AE0929|nr:long-chain fatty acid--CoA ligase [Desulforhopalus sp. IMCC35007]TKB10006.1 long-chain fatty acid--CoA ligase [Desulforhopalus sp. IMCC35007]